MPATQATHVNSSKTEPDRRLACLPAAHGANVCRALWAEPCVVDEKSCAGRVCIARETWRPWRSDNNHLCKTDNM